MWSTCGGSFSVDVSLFWVVFFSNFFLVFVGLRSLGSGSDFESEEVDLERSWQRRSMRRRIRRIDGLVSPQLPRLRTSWPFLSSVKSGSACCAVYQCWGFLPHRSETFAVLWKTVSASNAPSRSLFVCLASVLVFIGCGVVVWVKFGLRPNIGLLALSCKIVFSSLEDALISNRFCSVYVSESLVLASTSLDCDSFFVFTHQISSGSGLSIGFYRGILFMISPSLEDWS